MRLDRGQEGILLLSDSVNAFSFEPPLCTVLVLTETQTHRNSLRHMTRGSAVMAAASARPLGRLVGQGYWSARVLSELKLFITLSALSGETLSLMDHGGVLSCTCPCHPHTLSTIDPHVTCPCYASLDTSFFFCTVRKTLFLSSCSGSNKEHISMLWWLPNAAENRYVYTVDEKITFSQKYNFIVLLNAYVMNWRFFCFILSWNWDFFRFVLSWNYDDYKNVISICKKWY